MEPGREHDAVGAGRHLLYRLVEQIEEREVARLGVVDASTLAGSWWLPTWPSDRWYPPLLAIDHVLVGPGIVPVSADTFRVPATDHLGLVTRLRLP